MQRKIDSEIKVISNTDEIVNDQVLAWAKKEEALRTEVLEAGQTENETRTVKTCRYCGSISMFARLYTCIAQVLSKKGVFGGEKGNVLSHSPI